MGNALKPALTEAQKRLAKMHGTPAEFAAECYKAVPSLISMDEARAAIEKYNAGWTQAGKVPKKP